MHARTHRLYFILAPHPTKLIAYSYIFVPICRSPVKFLFAGWSLAEETQLLRTFVAVLVSYCMWCLFTTLYPLVILYCCIYFGMNSHILSESEIV